MEQSISELESTIIALTELRDYIQQNILIDNLEELNSKLYGSLKSSVLIFNGVIMPIEEDLKCLKVGDHSDDDLNIGTLNEAKNLLQYLNERFNSLAKDAARVLMIGALNLDKFTENQCSKNVRDDPLGR